MTFKSLFLVSMILVTATFARAAERDLTPATKCSAETVEHACSRGLQPALSLRFEANLGQTDRPVKFLSRGSGFGLFLTNQGAVLRLAQPKPSTVRIALTGQSSKTRIEGIDRLPGKTHYLKASWHGDVPTYGRVRYAGVYPGIDLVYYGNQQQLEYDFVVAPGADPKVIRLSLEGGRALKLGAQGDLVLSTRSREIRFRR